LQLPITFYFTFIYLIPLGFQAGEIVKASLLSQFKTDAYVMAEEPNFLFMLSTAL